MKDKVQPFERSNIIFRIYRDSKTGKYGVMYRYLLPESKTQRTKNYSVQPARYETRQEALNDANDMYFDEIGFNG